MSTTTKKLKNFKVEKVLVERTRRSLFTNVIAESDKEAKSMIESPDFRMNGNEGSYNTTKEIVDVEETTIITQVK